MENRAAGRSSLLFTKALKEAHVDCARRSSLNAELACNSVQLDQETLASSISQTEHKESEKQSGPGQNCSKFSRHNDNEEPKSQIRSQRTLSAAKASAVSNFRPPKHPPLNDIASREAIQRCTVSSNAREQTAACSKPAILHERPKSSGKSHSHNNCNKNLALATTEVSNSNKDGTERFVKSRQKLPPPKKQNQHVKEASSLNRQLPSSQNTGSVKRLKTEPSESTFEKTPVDNASSFSKSSMMDEEEEDWGSPSVADGETRAVGLIQTTASQAHSVKCELISEQHDEGNRTAASENSAAAAVKHCRRDSNSKDISRVSQNNRRQSNAPFSKKGDHFAATARSIESSTGCLQPEIAGTSVVSETDDIVRTTELILETPTDLTQSALYPREERSVCSTDSTAGLASSEVTKYGAQQDIVSADLKASIVNSPSVSSFDGFNDSCSVSTVGNDSPMTVCYEKATAANYDKVNRLSFADMQHNAKERFAEKFSHFNTLYADSHCHLDLLLWERHRWSSSFEKFRTEKVRSSFPDNFAWCIAVFAHPRHYEKPLGFDKVLSLVQEEQVFGSLGCHPKCAANGGWTEQLEATIRKMVASENNGHIVAIGECGLDFSQPQFAKESDAQQKAFIAQMKLAMDLQLPLVVHCRDAEEECFRVMQETLPHDYPVHRHCFTGSVDEMRKWHQHFTKLSFGFTPVVMYNRSSISETIKEVPIDKLLLETDAPYFLPRIAKDLPGVNGFSHPGMAICVGKHIAWARSMGTEQLLNATYNNTKQLYGVRFKEVKSDTSF